MKSLRIKTLLVAEKLEYLVTMKLSLIIPCFNEARNLPSLLERCAPLVKQGGIEIILVDNGSTDNTPKLLEELLPRYAGCISVRVPLNQGYGFGIVYGLKAASGNILAWTHADMQTDPQDVLKGLDFFNIHGNDIFVKGRRCGRPISDTIFTVAMSVFETLLLRKPMWDINAQPTMFSKLFFEKWSADAPHDFSLDLYAYYKAKNEGVPVYRFSVYFGKREYGVSHWNISWKAKWKFIKRTISYSLQLRRKVHS